MAQTLTPQIDQQFLLLNIKFSTICYYSENLQKQQLLTHSLTHSLTRSNGHKCHAMGQFRKCIQQPIIRETL
jgi:hypothetical protein